MARIGGAEQRKNKQDVITGAAYTFYQSQQDSMFQLCEAIRQRFANMKTHSSAILPT